MKPASVVAGLVIVAAVVGAALALKASRPPPGPAAAIGGPGVEATGLPRFVELGTTSCAPCKAMLGVLAELEARYPGGLQVELVNVQDHPDVADRLGIKVIPTQLFLAPDGRELYRHTGLMKTDDVVRRWAQLGFVLAPQGEG